VGTLLAEHPGWRDLIGSFRMESSEVLRFPTPYPSCKSATVINYAFPGNSTSSRGMYDHVLREEKEEGKKARKIHQT
jgi:hypothetical protein